MTLMRLSLINLLNSISARHLIRPSILARRLKFVLLTEASTIPSTREQYVRFAASAKLERMGVG